MQYTNHSISERTSAILSSLGLATFSPARKDLFLGAHGATSQGVTHPGIAPASNSLNFGVPTNPKPVSSQKASPRHITPSPFGRFGISQSTPLKGSDVLVSTLAPHGRVALIPNCHTPDRLRRSAILSSLGLATFSPARKDLFLGAHGATSQGVTHPGIAPASNSLNFGVPTNPKPVSSQKASRYEDARCAI
ncbi:hypothetical protein L3X38_017830 [Prunus dulcis]|uniref:Uncharacterized protein n=1 Tax=Prunus dulcis TaxID=3755 RepID=A0AAD4ZAJ3_PRUDU|nr:hypothetical protein L3X38_017830 [Prunus dulcis]